MVQVTGYNNIRATAREKKTMKVRVVPYNPEWPEKFSREKDLLSHIFKDAIVFCEHIGSTSIPDMDAKPVIDILISAHNITEIDAFNHELEDLEYIARGEFGIPGRRFFVKDCARERSYQIHVFQNGNSQLLKHINFREYMIAHPDAAHEYAQLKIELAQRFPDDVRAYSEAKDAFIKNIDTQALHWMELKTGASKGDDLENDSQQLEDVMPTSGFFKV